MGGAVVKKTSFVEDLKNLFPLVNLVHVIARVDLHSVKPVVLSPVWPRLKFIEKCVFHNLLKFVRTVRSGEEWYLAIIIFFNLKLTRTHQRVDFR